MGTVCSRTIRSEQIAETFPVTLNIYDIGTSGKVAALNKVLRPLGTGAFHCGVEVFGTEWSYGDFPEGSGVFSCDPQDCEGHVFQESVHLGGTVTPPLEFAKLMEYLEVNWQGREYDLLTRNCTHFCQELCVTLAVRSMPDCVTNLAETALAMAKMSRRIDRQRKSIGTLLRSRMMTACCCDVAESGAGGSHHPVELITVIGNCPKLANEPLEASASGGRGG